MLAGTPDELRARADHARHRFMRHPSQARRADLLDGEADRLTRARHHQGRAAVRREVTPSYFVRRQAQEPHPQDTMTGAQMVSAALVGGLGWAGAWTWLAHRTRDGHRPHGQRAALVGLGSFGAWLVVALVVGWPTLWGLLALQISLAPWAYVGIAWLWGWDAFPEWHTITADSPDSRADGPHLAETPRATTDDGTRTPHIDW